MWQPFYETYPTEMTTGDGKTRSIKRVNNSLIVKIITLDFFFLKPYTSLSWRRAMMQMWPEVTPVEMGMQLLQELGKEKQWGMMLITSPSSALTGQGQHGHQHYILWMFQWHNRGTSILPPPLNVKVPKKHIILINVLNFAAVVLRMT